MLRLSAAALRRSAATSKRWTSREDRHGRLHPRAELRSPLRSRARRSSQHRSVVGIGMRPEPRAIRKAPDARRSAAREIRSRHETRAGYRRSSPRPTVESPKPPRPAQLSADRARDWEAVEAEVREREGAPMWSPRGSRSVFGRALEDDRGSAVSRIPAHVAATTHRRRSSNGRSRRPSREARVHERAREAARSRVRGTTSCTVTTQPDLRDERARNVREEFARWKCARPEDVARSSR